MCETVLYTVPRHKLGIFPVPSPLGEGTAIHAVRKYQVNAVAQYSTSQGEATKRSLIIT